MQTEQYLSPVGARRPIDTESDAQFRPYRALVLKTASTQGVALGYHIAPRRGLQKGY